MLGKNVQKAATRVVLTLVLLLMPSILLAIDYSNRYRSPRNPERKVRKSTELIVLHTTEAPARSSLTKLRDYGEAHFCVTEEGTVYRIMDRDRVAAHAGRSMWNGKEDVSEFSIGIECVGYHDKAMSTVQLAAIRDLVKELQSMYSIPDERVVCHSHVAYGPPNKWHKQKHRGRKRCGMLFAMPSVRALLGLRTRPARDQDVRAKRLVVGDAYLEKVLYGCVDTMKSTYANAKLSKPESGGIFSWFTRKSTASAASSPPTTPAKTVATAKTSAPKTSASKSGAAKAKPTTPPKTASKPKTAAPPKAVITAAQPKSIADLKARGYRLVGSVSREQTALKIAGSRWNAADTYYTIRNKVISGSAIDPARIERGMSIWLKK